MLQNEVWDQMFQCNYGKYPGEDLIRFVAKNFYKYKERDKIKILEVGCGTGGNLWYLANEGFSTYGIDGSSIAINKARERIERENLNADLIIGDIVNLPYSDQYFDAVIDSECLYSNDVNNVIKIILEIARVLKTNGVFYSRTFSTETYKGNPIPINEYEYYSAQSGPFENAGFFRLMDRNSIQELYGRFFEILSVDKSNYTRNNGELLVSEWHIVSRKSAK